jgi:hypothetical protein
MSSILRVVAVALLILAACKKEEKAGGGGGGGGGGMFSKAAKAAGGPPAASGVTCEAGCKKVLGCLGATNGEGLRECMDACTPGDPELAQIAAMSCDQLRGALQAQMGAGAGAGDVGEGGYGDVGYGEAGGEADEGQGAAPAGGGCTADCTGCVGDGSSCYAAAGGSHGIPCDACCCAAGGPAPVWR